MKFLVDSQLPPALAQYLRKRGFDCIHVFDAGLGSASDFHICQYAGIHEFIIISKDEDFFYLASQPRTRIRLLWVRLGNCRTSVLLDVFERFWPIIESRLIAGDRIIEIL